MTNLPEIWEYQYRPNSVDDYICTDAFKERINGWLTNNFEHLLFESDKPGTGKTTLAWIIARANSGEDVYKINGSSKNGIDVVRNEITKFVSYYAIDGGRRTLIIDEAERLTPEAQDALKSLMDDYGDRCRFIYTCNHFNRLIEPLVSRATGYVKFKAPVFGSTPEEHKQIKIGAYLYFEKILINENIDFDPELLKKLVKASMGDDFYYFRNAIGKLYTHTRTGVLIDGDYSIAHVDLQEAIKAIKSGSTKDIMQFVKNNSSEWYEVFNELYNGFLTYFDAKDAANCMILMSAYQDQANRAVVKEIPLTALFYELRKYFK